LKINGRGVVTVSGGNSSVVFLINAASTVSLIGLTVIQGQGVTGGGIENRGILTVTNCTISQNTATSGGGGVDNFGTLTLIHSTISENTAGFLGGGILNSGSLTMLNSSVSNNTLTPGAGHNGGGIANGGDATLINTTVSGNSVDESTSWAGGISHRGRTFNLINSTVTNNSSGSGGGIDTHIASFNVRNSIIANNHAPREADCYCTPITSQGFNLIQNTEGTVLNGDLTGNIIGADPGLGALRNNGGSTLTHALLPGSPALNAGSNALAVDLSQQPLTTDQRGPGFPRIVGGKVDMGAFEGNAGGDGAPIITSVRRTYEGFFLQGTAATNDFNIEVNWNGGPGRIKFQINNDSPFEVQASSNNLVQSFSLSNSFPASVTPSSIRMTPINSSGTVGETRTEQIYILPWPSWLNFAIQNNPNTWSFTVQPGEIRYRFVDIEFPRPHLEAEFLIPKSVPFIGGEFGLTETYGTFNGELSSNGTGSFSLTGQTGFLGLGAEIDGSVSGSGNFLVNSDGFKWTDGVINPKLTGRVSRYASLSSAIPSLKKFNHIPLVRSFTESVKLRGDLETEFDFILRGGQNATTGDLELTDGTGEVSVRLKGTVNAPIGDRGDFQGWVGGGGSMTVGAPTPYVRRFDLTFEAGAKISFDHLFGGKDFTFSYTPHCFWIPATQLADCSSSEQDNAVQMRNERLLNSRLNLLERRYEDFGRYEFFRSSIKDLKAQNEPKTEGSGDFLISNVFPGAKPLLLPVGEQKQLMLWVRQNVSLQLLQSTELAWSYFDGVNWTSPSVVANDTRAEFSPVAGVDSNGKAIAAWLRVKDPAFATPINNFDDLPLFYKNVEIVSATFDSLSMRWSEPSQITDDSALDTSLRLSADSAGKLLLTWQSNPSGEFTATSAVPSSLKYTFWNGSNWNTPNTVASNLSYVNDHAAALRGNEAFIILPRDPDPNVSSDQTLLLLIWNGTTWSQPSVFASGGKDNLTPLAAYDAEGVGQVIWRAGTDLLHATTNNQNPKVIRRESDSLAFSNLKLLNNSAGYMALIWEEMTNNGPASIYAMTYGPQTRTWNLGDLLVQSDGRMSSDPSGFITPAGNLQLAYLSTEILRTSKTVVIGNESITIPNLPVEGGTDLRVMNRLLARDLAVTNASLSLIPALPALGQSAVAQVNIKNPGDLGITSFEVGVYAGNPDTSGILLGRVRVAETVVAGGSLTVSVPFTNLTGGEIVVLVDALDEIPEVTNTNNRASITLPLTGSRRGIGGRVSMLGVGVGQVVMTLTTQTQNGPASGKVMTSANGDYSFSNLPASQTYTVTPSKEFYTFSPPNSSINLSILNAPLNFTATLIPNSPVLTISGTAKEGGAGLGGVLITLTSPTSPGYASVTTTTAGDGTFAFTHLPAGHDYTVTPSKQYYSFGAITVHNLMLDFKNLELPGTRIPALISEPNSTRALAIESVTGRREPFDRFSPILWGTDNGTRVMLFAVNVDVVPGEDLTSFWATGQDASGTRWHLPVEYVGKVPSQSWLTCVVVNLKFVGPSVSGDLLVQLNLRGKTTNRVRLGYRQIGGGPPDDPGSVPTPGYPP
jgi:hypothetical protein